jgi:hypothetical protein
MFKVYGVEVTGIMISITMFGFLGKLVRSLLAICSLIDEKHTDLSFNLVDTRWSGIWI